MQDDKRLEGMRNNTRGDWTIADVEALCRSYGISYRPPNKGSHAKVSHPSQAEILTIPFARPIKPVYIKRLVKLVDAVVTARALQAIQDALVNKDRKT
jgi:hypothetical protein